MTNKYEDYERFNIQYTLVLLSGLPLIASPGAINYTSAKYAQQILRHKQMPMTVTLVPTVQ